MTVVWSRLSNLEIHKIAPFTCYLAAMLEIIESVHIRLFMHLFYWRFIQYIGKNIFMESG
ncbi:hypothetical protein NCCP2050_13970 [Planococcus sp. NCCP-2050]|nr:hypothetical protein NCCP2050_13970 [Planococcus sp. NCCP-2050]